MTQEEALAVLRSGASVYLTGAAGAGKTHVLRQFIDIQKARGKRLGITASTGIAATHLQGSTIHSWAGFGIKERLTEYDLDAMAQNEKLVKRYASTDILIIDEVSMLHAQQLDFVDRIARELRQSDEPFGGLQMVLTGDLFQLPPISKSGQASFVTNSAVWKRADLKICYLNEQHRQDDDILLSILSDIRNNDVTEDTRMPLRDRYRQGVVNGHTPTKLYTHNVDVDRINDEELEKLEGTPHIFEMVTTGSKKRVESLKKSCLAPEKLKLKEGAIVMFVKNAQDRKYVNGTMGVVENFDKDTGLPVVRTYQGKSILATQESWRMSDDGKVKAEISQIPLRLAWAITVHKSQGMSLDAAEIDLSRSFTPGMGYVALSRVRTLDGLSLMGMNEMGFTVHEEVLEIDQELKDASDELREIAQKLITEQAKDDKKRGKAKETVVLDKREAISKDDQPSDLRKKGYSMVEIREIYPNAYRKWSKDEEEKLVKIYDKNPDLGKLAKTFGRGSGGVRRRLVELGKIEE